MQQRRNAASKSVMLLFIVLAGLILAALVAWPAGAQDASRGDAKPQEQVEPFYGSFGTSVPIEVPGFHGIEPGLALSYNSASGNGFAGVGWSLSGLSTIERASPGKGAPKYDGLDIFLLDGQELIPCTAAMVSPSCTTGGSHATKIESYRRITRDEAGNRWEVTSRDGTVSSYEPTLGPDTTAGAGTFRWALESIIDNHGNSVTYSYWSNTYESYPEKIAYNSTDIHFFWDNRPDGVTYATGDAAKLAFTDQRLVTIDVKTGGQRVRSYELAYAPPSLSSGRSLLESVRVYGRDATLDSFGAVSAGSGLPATTFDYYDEIPNFAAGSVWSTGHAGTANDGEQVSYADVNGDSLSDMIFRKTDNSYWVSRSIGDGFAAPELWVSIGSTYKPDQANYVDVNGDGMADLVFRNANNIIVVHLSTGTSFGPSSPNLNMGGSYRTGQALFGDVNGDGMADLVFRKTTQTYVSTTVRLSTSDCSDFRRYTEFYFASLSCPSGYDEFRTWESKRDNREDVTICTAHKECRNYNIRQDIIVAPGAGTGFAPPSTWLSGLTGANGDYEADQVKLADLDGDGKSDLVFRAAGNTLKVSLSTGSGFTAPADWVSFGGTYYSGQAQLADLNADGKSDVIFRAVTTGCITFDVKHGHCHFPPPCPAGSTVISSGSCKSRVNSSTGDVSNSWTATCQSCSGSGLNFQVSLSTGNGFTQPQIWQAEASAYRSGQAKYADVNGDGRADLIFQDGSNRFKVSLSTGTDFATPTVWASPGGSYDDDQAQYADVNGDGRDDLLFHASDQTISAFLATPGGAAETLRSVTASLGGTTTVEYTPSSAWDNANLPFPVQTVSALTTDDGRGNVATTSYEYAGGLWDSQERRFLGFRTVEATLPCIDGETACPTTKTWFVQDYGAHSKPEKVERRDGAGNLLSEAVEVYSINGDNLPYTSLNTESRRTLLDGATSRTTKTTRVFDAYANVIEATSHGDVALATDDITTATDYAPNEADYIVGLPARVQTFEGAGTSGMLLAESLTYYDGAVTWNAPPLRGDATMTQAWDDQSGGYVTTQAEYDAAGNLTATVDLLGARSELVYDATYNRFVVETRDALYTAGDLRHKTTAVWDPVCGAVTETTDMNGQTTSHAYDVFCRRVRTDSPLGGFAATSYANLGDPLAQYVETQSPPADGSENLWSRAYLDGFGRTYRGEAKGPAAGQDIVTETAFNARGAVVGKTLPRYAGDPSYETTTGYDALDRVVEVVYPDLNGVDSSYGLGDPFASTTITDELGQAVTTSRDAYGRVVKRETTLDGVPVVTTFSHDPLGRLTGITDDAGNQWRYTYSSLGRKLTASDPDLGDWSYEYDAAGRLTARTDALGQRTEFTYDALGRRLTKTTRADQGTKARTTTWTYDEERAGFGNVGRLTTASNKQATISHDYDVVGRMVRKTYRVGKTDYSFRTGYDAAGRVLWQEYPDGDSVGSAAEPFVYDAAGRLVAIPGVIDSIDYNAHGQATATTRANGTVTTASYSPERGLARQLANALRRGHGAGPALHPRWGRADIAGHEPCRR